MKKVTALGIFVAGLFTIGSAIAAVATVRKAIEPKYGLPGLDEFTRQVVFWSWASAFCVVVVFVVSLVLLVILIKLARIESWLKQYGKGD